MAADGSGKGLLPFQLRMWKRSIGSKQKESSLKTAVKKNGVTIDTLCEEPFRLFFPLAMVAGFLGVSLWPLYFAGFVTFYPGLSHARLMAYGFFGGFIVGFLGTALPRMLSVRPLGRSPIAMVIALYAATVTCLVLGRIVVGDVLFILLLLWFGSLMGYRVVRRGDLPPPGFVLVALALICGVAGAVLSILQNYSETAFFWAALQHLLAYQGFILLPILGVGPFLFPRFFGLPSKHNFPESVTPPAGWSRKALFAFTSGALVLTTFWVEAAGWLRLGPGLRFVVALGYLGSEIPWRRSANSSNTPGRILKLALALLLVGFLAIVLRPEYRVGLLHLSLVGGFAIITLTVALRVVFGHSGNLDLLDSPNRWLWIAAGLMLLGMVTRLSGDFWPDLLASHYSYGALLWIAGGLVWSFRVLPKVLVPDRD